MNNTIKYLSAAVLFSFVSYGQKKEVTKADKEYEKCAYVDAVKVYEKVFEKGYKSADMLGKLGNAYYFQADYANASKWYEELFLMPDKKEAEYYYRYAQSLKATGNYAKADDLLNEFYKMDKTDNRALLAKEQKNYLDVIKKNSGRYAVVNAGINSNTSDYGSAFLGNSLVFASGRDVSQVNPWNGGYCTDLYIAELQEDGTLGQPSKFGGKLNTKYNESTPVFTKDGQTVYFTRNNFNDGKKRANKNNITLLKLYKATKDGNDWKDIKELPFNSNDYSVAHPALSPDEKTLYFVSDMPGTFGDSDIFKVSIKGKDSYSAPVNLGPSINTQGKESFPYVTDENKIYFASDGYPGLGGLDIFVGKIDNNGAISNIQNVGSDINSPQDDFAYIINTKTQRGYFSSNRTQSTGSDDIFFFKEAKCELELKGVITDAGTGNVLPEAKVTLFDSEMKVVNTITADTSGKYNFMVECGKAYYVRAEKENYSTQEVCATINDTSGKASLLLSFALEKFIFKVQVGDDLAKTLSIKNIYFDLNKSDITAKAVLDLEKILSTLEDYPNMKLDIRSHTDCRGSSIYNMQLSDRRAKSTIQWLVKQGVNADRLTGRGYGESLLLNNCNCEGKTISTCSDEEHQENRRSEFIITKI